MTTWNWIFHSFSQNKKLNMMQCLVARANDFTFFRETKKNCPLLLKESTHKGKAYRTEEFQMCEWQRKKGFIPIVNGSEDVGFLMPCMVTPSHKSINPFRTKTPNYLFFRGKKNILSSNWQHKFHYFHYKSVKLDVLFRQNKIWTFGHPCQSKKVANLHPE